MAVAICSIGGSRLEVRRPGVRPPRATKVAQASTGLGWWVGSPARRFPEMVDSQHRLRAHRLPAPPVPKVSGGPRFCGHKLRICAPTPQRQRNGHLSLSDLQQLIQVVVQIRSGFVYEDSDA
ncbi:unnamed protein product [Symbiodinium necroappetens]|uniref:Uncharacterized protein n=1 Tax=Symbiodinium necroappetens TaxID=1628268 RepID=A0A812YZI6_9DINO|nr:unnamed protein product [Symbiodinium necroappetens]